MPRYRAVFDGKGLLAEYSGEELTYLRPDYVPNMAESDLPRPQVIRDIDPYQNMIDGRMISSRSEHRELLRRHNCVEVGNETMKSEPVKPKNTRREQLHRRLADVSDREANKVLKSLRKEFQK